MPSHWCFVIALSFLLDFVLLGRISCVACNFLKLYVVQMKAKAKKLSVQLKDKQLQPAR